MANPEKRSSHEQINPADNPRFEMSLATGSMANEAEASSSPSSPSAEAEDHISIKGSVAPSHASTISEHIPDETRSASRRPSLRSLSRRSTITPDAVVVDRKNRRGLFANLAVLPEVENPYHYARKTKWLITIIVAVCGMAGPLGSAIIMPALGTMSKKFEASSTVTNMSVAVYMLAMGIFPLWWSSFSEITGRRTIYIISFTLFVVWAVLAAVSMNITVLIVMRTLSGGAAASVQAVGGGTIADIWEVRERGKAMGVFYLGPLCGPLLAPIFGGALTEGLGWRSTQWFLVIYGGVTLVLILFGLPETLRRKSKPTQATAPATGPYGAAGAEKTDLARVSTRQSVQIKTKSSLAYLRRTLIDPLLILVGLRYAAIAVTVYYASVTFGSLYVLNISLQATFSKPPYSFSTIILGLLYIPNSLGYFLASVFGGRWIDYIMHREAKKAGRYDEHGKLIFRPEDRMRENAWIAAFMWPLALIVYGWTAQKGVYWIVPIITNFFFGVGSMLIFSLATTQLTEFMPKRTSSGIAINNFVRNLCSFTGAVVAEPVINAIGNGWVFTILGLWSLISGVAVIIAMRIKGAQWREAMGDVYG